MTKPAAPPAEREDGFVLLFVLLVIALLSLLASAMMVRSGSAIDVAKAERSGAEERLLLEAATARALRSFEFDGDPMRLARSTRGDPVRWQFDGDEVSLFVEREGAKVDANAGDMRLVQRAVADTQLSQASRAAVLEAIGQYRAAGVIIPSLGALLPACDRLGNGTARLARNMTILTRQPIADGVDPNSLDAPTTGDSTSNSGAPPVGMTNPLVTVVAMTPRLEQRTLVRALGKAPHYEVIQSSFASPGIDDVCLANG